MARVLIFCDDPACTERLGGTGAPPSLELVRFDREGEFLLNLLEQDYDAAVYDLEHSRLGGLFGVKIVRRVRPKVPLLVISHDPSRELGGQILQEGVFYYAIKPVDSAAFRKALWQAATRGEQGA